KGMSLDMAHAAMACALGSNAEVSAAAYLRTGELLLRVAGFAPSVEARCAALPRLMAGYCALTPLSERDAAPLWQRAMTGSDLVGSIRWDVHLPPRRAPELVSALQAAGVDWAMDWGGGRVWIALEQQ